MDPIRAAIQAWLDDDGDGWQVSHFAVVMGLDRFQDGDFEDASFLYAPPMQADYVTNGLVIKAGELQRILAEGETD
jgi:hypothetical protein